MELFPFVFSFVIEYKQGCGEDEKGDYFIGYFDVVRMPKKSRSIEVGK